MEEKLIKVPAKSDSSLSLKLIPGHFATSHSHINYYVKLTTMKVRQNEAKTAARIISREYSSTTIVDTIVCMDGCEVIGAYLADFLTDNGIMSINTHQTISIVTPEIHSNGQMIFRDNLEPMIKDRNIILLLASATTGKTIKKSLECINYYGGLVRGISAIFSAAEEIDGIPVHSIFQTSDIENYATYPPEKCPLCQSGIALDAIVNSYGYSKI